MPTEHDYFRLGANGWKQNAHWAFKNAHWTFKNAHWTFKNAHWALIYSARLRDFFPFLRLWWNHNSGSNWTIFSALSPLWYKEEPTVSIVALPAAKKLEIRREASRAGECFTQLLSRPRFRFDKKETYKFRTQYLSSTKLTFWFTVARGSSREGWWLDYRLGELARRLAGNCI